jgi:hypothetical protein
MESIVCLILGICFIILSVFVTGACWIVFLDTKFKTLNKRMVIISIILGILWPIGLPILCIVAIISEFMDRIKNN